MGHSLKIQMFIFPSLKYRSKPANCENLCECDSLSYNWAFRDWFRDTVKLLSRDWHTVQWHETQDWSPRIPVNEQNSVYFCCCDCVHWTVTTEKVEKGRGQQIGNGAKGKIIFLFYFLSNQLSTSTWEFSWPSLWLCLLFALFFLSRSN